MSNKITQSDLKLGTFLNWNLTGEVFRIIEYFHSDKMVLCYSSHYTDQLLLLKDSAFLSKKVEFIKVDVERYAHICIQNKNDDSLINKAKNFAIKCVYDTNHYYGKDEDQVLYSYHLAKVFNVTMIFIHLVDHVYCREVVLASAWTHDSIEDHRITRGDLSKALDEGIMDVNIAALSFALTNEKGATRADRANAKYYSDMKNVYYADFLKLMDRVANIEEDGDMKSKYKKEMPNFFEKLKNISVDEDVDKFDEEIQSKIKSQSYVEAISLIQRKKSALDNNGVYPNFDDMNDLKYIEVWKHMHKLLN